MSTRHNWRPVRRTAVAVTVGVVGLLAALAGVSGAQESHTTSGGSITVRLTDGDYDQLNPALTGTYAGAQMAEFLYDRVISLSSSGQPVPYLASSWTVKGATVTLHIRRGATCADGTPVTASVVRNSLAYLGAKSTGAFPAPVVFGPAGLKSITASNSASTVKIVLNKPFSGVLTGLANPAASIICPAGLSHIASLKNEASGSGPYVITTSVRDSNYTLTLRKGYDWGPEGTDYAKMPATVNMEVVGSDTTAANELEGGTLQLGAVLGRDVQRLRSDKSLVDKTASIPTANALVFNERKGYPGADPDVRKAIAMVVNAKDYNDASSFGLDQVSRTMFTPGMTCYNAADAKADLSYDPKAAKALLLKDGYKAGANGVLEKNGKPLLIRILDPTLDYSGPAYLQSALQSIGIETKVSEVDISTYVNDIYTTGTSQWDLQEYGYGGPFPTIPEYLALQVSGGGPIDMGDVENPTFNKLADEANASGTNSCSTWDAAERSLLTQANVIPISVYNVWWFGAKDVNYTPSFGVSVDPFTLTVG